MTESIIKIVLAGIIIVAALLFFIIPKTRLGQRLKMSEPLFIAVNVTGIICALGGLLITFLYPGLIIEYHLWELIILPFALIQVYILLIQKVDKSRDIFDEKQAFNLNTAAAVTWALSIPVMAILFMLYMDGILAGLLWFPFYLFTGLLIYSAGSLYYFKQA